MISFFPPADISPPQSAAKKPKPLTETWPYLPWAYQMAEDVADALAWWTEVGMREGGGGAQMMRELSAEEDRS